MASQTERPQTSNAFPFETENPSGVPGATEIEGRVIAAIAGHAAEDIEGVASIGRNGLVRAVASILASEEADKASGIDFETGNREVIFDIDLTVMYGFSVPTIVKDVREAIAKEVFDQAGLLAKEINVIVRSVEFTDRSARARVN